MSTLSPYLWCLLAVGFVLTDALLFTLGYWVGQLRQRQAASATNRQEVARPVDAVADPQWDRLDGLEGRLRQVESALRRTDMQPRFEPAAAQPGTAPMDVAARLARSGSSVEELMNVCKLGRGEAELIRVLYGSERAA